MSSNPSKWFGLDNIDIIKHRNKPVKPPKKPKSAPFFFPLTNNDHEGEIHSKIITGEGNLSEKKTLNWKSNQEIHFKRASLKILK